MFEGIRPRTRRGFGVVTGVMVAALVISVIGAPSAAPAFQPDVLIVDGPLVSRPVVASQSSGASLVAWPQRDGSSWRIRAQRLGVGGKPSSDAVWISAPGGTASGVSVDVSPLGDGVIGWKQFVDGAWRIRFRRWWASGSLGPIKVISSPTVVASYVDVAIAIDRTVIAVWDQAPPTNGAINGIVRAVRWRAIGDPEVALRLADSPWYGRPAPRPVVDMNARGDAVVIFGRENTAGCNCADAWGLQWRANEDPHPSRRLLLSDETNFFGMQEAAVGVDGDGGAVISYVGYGGDGDAVWNSTAQRWSASGALTTAALYPENGFETFVPQKQPGVAVNTGGDAVVTWVQAAQDSDGQHLFGRKWLAGAAITAAVQLSPDGPADPWSVPSSQVSMRDGRVMLVWNFTDLSRSRPNAVESRSWVLAPGGSLSPVTSVYSSGSGRTPWVASSSSAAASTLVWTTQDVPQTRSRLHSAVDF